MGTNEKLVPGKLLMTQKYSLEKYTAKQFFKINIRAKNICLNKNISEEITHV